jgi:hypothetical protein
VEGKRREHGGGEDQKQYQKYHVTVISQFSVNP